MIPAYEKQMEDYNKRHADKLAELQVLEKAIKKLKKASLKKSEEDVKEATEKPKADKKSMDK